MILLTKYPALNRRVKQSLPNEVCVSFTEVNKNLFNKKMENKRFILSTNGSSALSRIDQDELNLKNTPNLSKLLK